MSKGISRKKLRDFAFTLRAEAMDHCISAHALNDTVEPRKWAATKEKGETKRSIAIRIEAILDGVDQ